MVSVPSTADGPTCAFLNGIKGSDTRIAVPNPERTKNEKDKDHGACGRPNDIPHGDFSASTPFTSPFARASSTRLRLY